MADTSEALARFLSSNGTVKDAGFRGLILGSEKAPTDCVFEDCDFSGAVFDDANLAGLTFKKCTFQQTSFAGASLSSVTFQSPTSLEKSDFKNCTGGRPKFLNCDLSALDFNRAQLTNADFSGSTLTEANFEAATLTGYRGLCADGTRFQNAALTEAYFSPLKHPIIRFFQSHVEPWRALRRRFTGLNLFLSILPPVIFILCLRLLIETLFTSAMFISTQAEPITFLAACQQNKECAVAPLWHFAFGLHQSFWATAFIVFAIAHNGLRFFTTLRVSSLAGEEDVNGVTPARGTYLRLRWLSYGLSISQWVMLGLFCWNMYDLAIKEVPLPPVPEQSEG